MIKFDTSLPEDLPTLIEWITADPYHFHQGQPEWWLTGNGLLAFTLIDERGPLCFVRLDEEGEYVRIHTQFAPESVVSKRRLIAGMIHAMKVLIDYSKGIGKRGMIFNSVSPSLIAFMSKNQKFLSVGQNDYRLDFEE